MKKVLYLECKTGAAGDMLMGALYSLLTEEQKTIFLKKINKYLFPSRLPFTKTLEDGNFNFLPGSIVIDSIISHKLLPILSQKNNYNMITT